MSCGWEDPPLEGVMVSNLPLLFASGLPTSLEKMSVGQLHNFIPFMLKCSMGRAVSWDSQPPEWWPAEVPFTEAVIQPTQRRNVALSILTSIVQCCYSYHGCEYLLQFCGQLAQCSGYRFHDNWDGTTSMYDGTSGKLLVTFRNENRDYDKKDRELTASTSRRNLMPRNLAPPANPAAKSAPAMVQPPICDVYLCDTCDAEFTSLQDIREHERVCGLGHDTTPEPSDEEEEPEETLDQVQFLSYLQVEPALHTGKAPYVSPRKKLQKPVKRSFGSSYHRYSNVAFTSQMGQYILKNSKVGSNIMTRVNVDRYERYCGTGSGALKQRTVDRIAGLDKWPVTYRAPRFPSGKKRVEVWTHLYSFTKREWIERIHTINTGLNRRARKLKRLCRKVKVVFHRLTEEQIDYWTRPATLPVIIDVTGNTPVAQFLTSVPVKHWVGGIPWTKSYSPSESLGVPSNLRNEDILGIPWPSELEVKRVTVSETANSHLHTNGPGNGMTAPRPVFSRCRPDLQSHGTGSNKVIEFDGITVIDLCSSSEEDDDDKISFKHITPMSEKRLIQQPLANSAWNSGKGKANLPANNLTDVVENKIQGSSFNSYIKPEKADECTYENHKDILPKNGFSHWPLSESVQQRQLLGHSEELTANGSCRLSDISTLYPNRLALVRVLPDVVVRAKLKSALMLKCCSIVLEDVEGKELCDDDAVHKEQVDHDLYQGTSSELQVKTGMENSQQISVQSCTKSVWLQSDKGYQDASNCCRKTGEKRAPSLHLTNPTPSKAARIEFIPLELTLVPVTLQLKLLHRGQLQSSPAAMRETATISRNTDDQAINFVMQKDKITPRHSVEELAGTHEQKELSNAIEMEKSNTAQLEVEEKQVSHLSRMKPCLFDEETVFDSSLTPSVADDDDVISFNPKYQLTPEYLDFKPEYQTVTEDIVSFHPKFHIPEGNIFHQKFQVMEDPSFNPVSPIAESDDTVSFHPKYETMIKHEDSVSFNPKYQTIAQYRLDDSKEDGSILKTLLNKSAEFLQKFWKVNNSELYCNQKFTKETVVSQFVDNNVGPESVLKEKLLGDLETEIMSGLSSRADEFDAGKQVVQSDSDSPCGRVCAPSQVDKPCSIGEIIRKMEKHITNRKEEFQPLMRKVECCTDGRASQLTSSAETCSDDQHHRNASCMPLELELGGKNCISHRSDNPLDCVIDDSELNIPVVKRTDENETDKNTESLCSSSSQVTRHKLPLSALLTKHVNDSLTQSTRSVESCDVNLIVENEESRNPVCVQAKHVGIEEDTVFDEAVTSQMVNDRVSLPGKDTVMEISENSRGGKEYIGINHGISREEVTQQHTVAVQRPVDSKYLIFEKAQSQNKQESTQSEATAARVSTVSKKVRNLLLDECKELRSSGLDGLRPRERKTRNGTVLGSSVPGHLLHVAASLTADACDTENASQHSTETRRKQMVALSKELKCLFVDECKELRSTSWDYLRWQQRKTRSALTSSVDSQRVLWNKLCRQMSSVANSEQKTQTIKLQKAARINELKNLLMDECKELRSSGLDNLRFPVNRTGNKMYRSCKSMKRKRKNTILMNSKRKNLGKASVLVEKNMNTALKTKSSSSYSCIPRNDYPRELKQFRRNNKKLSNLDSKVFSYKKERHPLRCVLHDRNLTQHSTENKSKKSLSLKGLKNKYAKQSRGCNRNRISSDYKSSQQINLSSNIPQVMHFSVVSYNKKWSIDPEEENESSAAYVSDFSPPQKKYASLRNELQSLFLDECKELRTSGLEDLNSLEERLTRRGTVFQENDKNHPWPRQRLLIREGASSKYPSRLNYGLPVVQGTCISIYRTDNMEKPYESHKRMLKTLCAMCVLNYEMPPLTPTKSDFHTKDYPSPSVSQKQLQFTEV